MKQFLSKTTLLLLTGFLLAHTAYLTENTTDNAMVCASTDTSNSISTCIVDDCVFTPIIY